MRCILFITGRAHQRGAHGEAGLIQKLPCIIPNHTFCAWYSKPASSRTAGSSDWTRDSSFALSPPLPPSPTLPPYSSGAPDPPPPADANASGRV